ncbi:hypothetical protein [Roseobacter sp.]|uniref:hypothetical protein n=1 Tax=Roseobacter sp. TaxID=1907202 RepID=UPI0025CE3711|nr:hypothetical protein [Roseobacter sp.]
MPSVIFFETADMTPAARREGMISAGSDIRAGSGGVADKNDAEDLVQGILDKFADPATECHAVLATTGDDFRVLERQGNKYALETLANPGNVVNDKLELRGDIDDKNGNTFRMTAVVQQNAQTSAYDYISQTVVPDTIALVADFLAAQSDANRKRLEDYLIASFAFTRCR